jgi:selenide,water dikinase
MIATTTQLNTPGPELAALPGVHAMTDVTGFGLAGHALELARAAQSSLNIEWTRVPLIEGVLKLAADGIVTGASGRNFASYGHDIALPADFAPQDKALLTDPQTSGGLLVSCAEDSVAAVLQTFRKHGFASATEIGAVAPRGEALLTIR